MHGVSIICIVRFLPNTHTHTYAQSLLPLHMPHTYRPLVLPPLLTTQKTLSLFFVLTLLLHGNIHNRVSPRLGLVRRDDSCPIVPQSLILLAAVAGKTKHVHTSISISALCSTCFLLSISSPNTSRHWIVILTTGDESINCAASLGNFRRKKKKVQSTRGERGRVRELCGLFVM